MTWRYRLGRHSDRAAVMRVRATHQGLCVGCGRHYPSGALVISFAEETGYRHIGCASSVPQTQPAAPVETGCPTRCGQCFQCDRVALEEQFGRVS